MKVTVYLEREKGRFRVVRVKNATEPKTDSWIEEADVKSLIARGIEVIIDIPRNRARA
jgi:hypothetical protein